MSVETSFRLTPFYLCVRLLPQPLLRLPHQFVGVVRVFEELFDGFFDEDAVLRAFGEDERTRGDDGPDKLAGVHGTRK